ncbi:MAG: alanine racemase [Gammaproteobacteria bacterium]|uniref:alanine racemase n=1 Tax=Pseudomaricurvus alcaniphilus TaxID=1166482 RepID=UPI001408D35C|nr:alanine racemase [Pseudomaricurvus alcaniphilus]MBR9910803.1 alanine racemase [Gammaproteobacteria bacterium]NHN37319.1 alanine racemase [Pseudomaricurvus alcaniphilus]
MTRPCQAVIDLAALRHNCQLAQRLAPGSNIVAVVKANAYGHGAVPVARALQPLVSALAVSCTEEALELRAAGIHLPILLLEGPFEAAEIQLAAEHDFWLMLNNMRQVQWLCDAGDHAPLTVWLKADTGMNRLGLSPADLHSAHRQLQALPGVKPTLVLATHFAAADQLDSDFTPSQMARFETACDGLAGPRSLANSPALLAWPASHGDYVRPGIMLYGSSPFAGPQPNAAQLQPVMSLNSAVIAVREVAAGATVGYGRRWTARSPSRIATIAIGYGDGYPRHAPSGTPLLINGQRAALVGTVSMDMITADVTELDNIGIGSQVELWGKNLPVDEVAGWVGTIGYELLTRLSSRVARHYLD